MKKGNLIFSIVMLVLSVALSVGALLAWFSAISRASATGMSVNVSDGQLAFVDSIKVYKQPAGGSDWTLAAEYIGSSNSWSVNDTLTGGKINGILEGDVHKFSVTLRRTENANDSALSVSAMFRGIDVVNTNGGEVISGGDVTNGDLFKNFFLVGNEDVDKNVEYSKDRSFDTENGLVALTPDEGLSWEREDTFTFTFYIKFHNITVDDGWSTEVVPTITFKDYAISVQSLNINLSLASVNTDEEQGGNA